MESVSTIISICSAVYNQEEFVKQCLDGIVMQKSSYPFELLIHDDASSDGTADVIREYEKKYPDMVKPVYQTENQYSKGIKISLTYNFPRARGKYIAFCEGDDYWTDPEKLQKQVDFLENNPGYGMCFTRARQYDQDNDEFLPEPFGAPVESFSDLLNNGNRIPTLTVCMRKPILDQYLVEINPKDKNWLMGDYPIWLYTAKHSKIHFMDSDTGVYRVQNQSVSHFVEKEQRIKFIHSTFDIIFYFARKYKEHLDINIGLQDKIVFNSYSNPDVPVSYRVRYFFLKNRVVFMGCTEIQKMFRRALRIPKKFRIIH